MSGHVRLKFTVIQNSPTKKTKQIKKNERATDHICPSNVPHNARSKPIPVNPRYYHDEDNDTPCYKDFRIDGAAAL
jgi:hypothetical protein